MTRAATVMEVYHRGIFKVSGSSQSLRLQTFLWASASSPSSLLLPYL